MSKDASSRFPLSVQERLYPDLTCFGCGPANPLGLQLRSYSGLEDVTATFRPWPQHDNGLGFLNGGIISTLLDCHSAAAVVLQAERGGWSPLGGSPIPYVTAGLDVTYLRPSPLHEVVDLRAHITGFDEDEMLADVELLWDSKVRARATARWRRWRPRPSPAEPA